jgi:hypothetical protein
MIYRDNLLRKYQFKSFKVYPSLAIAKQVSTTGTYTLGDFTEIVPANAITTKFVIRKVQFANITGTGTYEVVLYSGLSGQEIEIGRTRIAKGTTGTDTILNIDMCTPILSANTRISAKIAYSSGGSNSLYMSIVYQEMG